MDPDLLSTVAHLSDDALISRVRQLAAREREATAVLIAHLAEMDVRRLYLDEGCSLLFTYCTQVLHLSEHAAYGRIEAARAARRFPVILERLEEGSVTLTTVGLLAAHLIGENHRDLLDAARCQSRRRVRELVARLRPQQAVPASVRRLPLPPTSAAQQSPGSQTADGINLEPVGATTELELSAGAPVRSFLLSSAPVASTPTPRAAIAPLAPERYKVQFTASAETYEKLRLAQALMRHQIPDGDVAAIFDRALTALLQDLTKQKFAAVDRPRGGSSRNPHSRHIPAEVKRAVLQRDGGRCAFSSRTGRRCAEQGFLEFHHVVPYAVGGEATVENIELRCRAHNGYEAEQVFGRGKTSRVKEPRAAYVSSKEQTSALRGLQPSAVARGRTEQQIADSGYEEVERDGRDRGVEEGATRAGEGIRGRHRDRPWRTAAQDVRVPGRIRQRADVHRRLPGPTVRPSPRVRTGRTGKTGRETVRADAGTSDAGVRGGPFGVLRSKTALADWIRRAFDYASALPAKGPAKTKTARRATGRKGRL